MRTATRLLAEPSGQARRADGFVVLTDPRPGALRMRLYP